MIQDMNVNIEDFNIFYQLVERGGFLRAATALNTCQDKISRRIARMEAVFGTMLVYRNMRDIRLTETGKIIYTMVKSVLEQVNQAHTDVQTCHRDPSGSINLTVAMGFAHYWLMPHLAEFKRMHPDIDIHLITDEWGVGDLMMGNADIAISTSRPKERERLICQLLCEYPFHIYASQDYLTRKGTPQSVEDLDHHDIVTVRKLEAHTLKKNLFNALLYLGKDDDGQRFSGITLTTDLAAVSATASGMGLSGMPSFFAAHHPELVRVTLEGEEEFLGQHKNQKFITYPKALEQSKRHKMLIQFIQKKAQKLNDI